MQEQVFYFTFGQIHTHPVSGERMRDYWVEVVAASYDKAEAKMREVFGEYWSNAYYEKNFSMHWSHYPKGCYERYEADE